MIALKSQYIISVAKVLEWYYNCLSVEKKFPLEKCQILFKRVGHFSFNSCKKIEK